MPNFNCSCDDTLAYRTLGELERDVIIRLGYAARVNNPPPGMQLLVRSFLQSAQNVLYRRYAPLRTSRFFTWVMTPGERFYDLTDNYDTCTKQMDRSKIEWAGVETTEGWWLKLIEGIPPEFYTAEQFQGIPQRYEIRQCIEVFPAPNAAYKLRIKANFGLMPFEDAYDQPTIDDTLVFLWALADAKQHYQQPDAEIARSEATAILDAIVAGDHGTRRYIPGTVQIPPWAPPIFLPLNGGTP